MIHMDLMRLNMEPVLISIKQMIFLNTFSQILDLIMMTMLISLEAFLIKEELKKDVALVDLVDLEDSTMTISLVKDLEMVSGVVVDLLRSLLLLLEEEEWEVYQNQLALLPKQCKYFINKFRNGKTVTVKKTTIVNPDGSK